MRSIPLAMTWELFWNGRWGLPCALLGAHAMPGLLLTALRHEGPFDPDEESSIVIHVVITLMNAVCVAAAIMTSQGNPSRLYAYPVPTSTLVAWQMLPAMATLFVESVLSTTTLNAVYQLDWPIWGPALFVTCGLAAVQGVLWLTEKSVWLIVGMTVVGGLLGTWHMSRYGLVLARPAHLWRDVTPGEIVTMLSFAMLSYGVAVVAVGRDRCGEALRSEALKAWIERLLDPAPASGQPSRSPLAAQFWFERRKGDMAWLVAFVLLIGFCGWVLFNRDPGMLLHGSLTVGYFLPVIGFVMGLVIGTTGPSDGKFEMSQFLATRPITNSDLSRVILKTTAHNVVWAWIVWCTAALVVSFVLWAANSLPAPFLPPEMHWWQIPGVLIGSWLTTALVACLILCGRPHFLAVVFVGVFALIIFGSLYGKWGLTEQQRQWFNQSILIANAGAFVLWTAWAFAAARRRLLIRSQTVTIAAGVWMAAAGLVALDLFLHHDRALPTQMLLAGVAALSLAPLAMTPLAVAWNRNR